MDPNEVPDNFDFLLSGVIDSFGILEMVSSIEDEFSIQLDMATLDAEQITILGPLSQYVAENTEADLSAGKPMTLLYQNASIFIHGFNHQLGRIRRDLNEMKADNRLAGTVETLSAVGYRYCYGLGDDETLVTLARKPLASALERAAGPRALLFQHCRAESAVLPFEPDDKVGLSRNQYFGGALMQELAIDHLPYFCSFASGCAPDLHASIHSWWCLPPARGSVGSGGVTPANSFSGSAAKACQKAQTGCCCFFVRSR